VKTFPPSPFFLSTFRWPASRILLRAIDRMKCCSPPAYLQLADAGNFPLSFSSPLPFSEAEILDLHHPSSYLNPYGVHKGP